MLANDYRHIPSGRGSMTDAVGALIAAARTTPTRVAELEAALRAFMDDSDPTWPDWLTPTTTGAPDQWLLANRALAPSREEGGK